MANIHIKAFSKTKIFSIFTVIRICYYIFPILCIYILFVLYAKIFASFLLNFILLFLAHSSKQLRWIFFHCYCSLLDCQLSSSNFVSSVHLVNFFYASSFKLLIKLLKNKKKQDSKTVASHSISWLVLISMEPQMFAKIKPSSKIL